MVDIYDNLENYQDVGAEAKLLSENEALKIKLSESQAAYNALKKGIFQDFDKLSTQHEQLSLNFSSLLRTARAEIERKTNAITQLNIEKDQLVIQSLKDTSNKVNLDRHNIRSWSKPKPKCGTGDKLVLQSEPDHHIFKEHISDRLPDGLKKVQDYPENQGNEELLHDPRQKDLGSQETAHDILSPGQGKENDYGHLKLTSGRISDRRKSMPVLRQQPKFSTDEEDDDVNSTGSHTYLPPIDEVDEGMKRVTHERHMKSGESSIQHNMRHGKLNPERDLVTRSRYGIEIDARNKPRGREKERFEGNYKSNRWEVERFRRNRNPSLGCQKEQNRSRNPPYDKYSRSKSRDRRSHYDKREPVFEYDRQKQTYHDSHYAKHNLHNIDEEPPNKRRKTDRSIDEVKHNEQIGQSKNTLTESSQSSRQSSLLRHEERTNKHLEFHNKKEVLTTKLIAGQSKEMLLNQYSQHPKQPLLIPCEQKSHRHIDEDNNEVMKSKQKRSQSKKVPVDSLQIPSQSSLLQHEDKTHKHFKEDHSRKSYEVKQTRSRSSTQLSSLLAEDKPPVNIENKHHEVDNEARQTEQIREILAAESQQSSKKSSLWPESKAHREIEVNKCNVDDDNRRKNDASKDNPPIFKATAEKPAKNENPANEINVSTERPPSSMSMESGEIDDTDEYSPVSAASSFSSMSVPKKTPTIQRRMSPRKSANTKSYKKPEKKHRQTSGKNNDHIQKKEEDILIAHKIVPIEALPDPCCVTSTYTIPKKNKGKSMEVLLTSVVTPKPDDRLSKHLKPQFSNKDKICNKKSSECTKPVSKISKSKSSKKTNKDRTEEISKHHKKRSPSPAETSKPIKVLIEELPPIDHTNIKDKKSSGANTDSFTIQLVTQPSSKNNDESKQKKKDIAIEGKRNSKEKVQVSKSKGSIDTVVKRKSKDAVEDDCQSNTDRDNNESMVRNLTSKADIEGDLQLSDESTDSFDIYGGIIQDKVGVPKKTEPMSITKAEAQNHGVEQKADKSDSKGDDSKSKDINAKLCELFGDSSSLVTLEDLIPTQNTEAQGSAYMPSPSQAALMAQNEFWDRENATDHDNDHTKMQTRSFTRQRKDSDDKMAHKLHLNMGDVSNDNLCESKKDLEINEINVIKKASKHVEVELPITDVVNRKESSPTADLPMLNVADIPLENIGTVEVPLSIHAPIQSCNEGYNEVIRVIPPPDEANEKDVYKTIVISTGTQPQCVKETVPVRREDTGYDTRTEPADSSVVVKEPVPIGKNVGTLMEALATSTPVRSQKVAEVIEPMRRNLTVLESIAHSPNTTDKTEVSTPQNSSDSSQTKTGGDVDVRIVMKRKRRFLR